MEASRGLPPTGADSAHGLTLQKVSVHTKGTKAIWAMRLRYIQRQWGLIHAVQPSQGHLLLVRVSGRGDPLYLQEPPTSKMQAFGGRKRRVTGFDRYGMVADLSAVKHTEELKKPEIKRPKIKSADARRVTA
ncbi:unnamed protein product [Pleuronectes platessa]|uniref:Uncharacterized protein n=1 Tax=Pleuronectes platessa TaxID=8262 RepID=A0A9N7TY11_PLEPL|nr:unnamed protein product [Pleuronectes platessa]